MNHGSLPRPWVPGITRHDPFRRHGYTPRAPRHVDASRARCDSRPPTPEGDCAGRRRRAGLLPALRPRAWDLVLAFLVLLFCVSSSHHHLLSLLSCLFIFIWYFFYLCSLSYSYLCSLGYFYLCSLNYSDLFTVIFIYVHLVNFIYVHLINLIFHLVIFLYFHCLSHMIFLLQSFSFISKLLSFSLFSLFHFVFYHSHLVFSPVSENVG